MYIYKSENKSASTNSTKFRYFCQYKNENFQSLLFYIYKLIMLYVLFLQLNYMIPFSLCILIFYVFEEDAYVSKDNIAGFVLLLFLYGLVLNYFMFLCSMWLKEKVHNFSSLTFSFVFHFHCISKTLYDCLLYFYFYLNKTIVINLTAYFYKSDLWIFVLMLTLLCLR